MTPMVHTNPVYQLLVQSDAMTKVILLILLVASIICWTLFLYKISILFVRKKQVAFAQRLVAHAKSIDDIRSGLMQYAKTVPGYLVGKQLGLLKNILETKAHALVLTHQELDLLAERMNQVVDEIIFTEESYLPVLSATAAAAPLLGLLGTIWGLVHAFVDISQHQQADIVTIAPGIAEALITTLAGLLVALPSMIMFHYLHATIRQLEQQLYLLSDKVSWIVQTTFMQR